MSIEPGTHLLHYRLIEQIGEGGMGVVWRAEDTKLGREVAVKVLHAAAAADPERLARLKREAKAAAAINHPNIVTLHSVEESEGVHFLTLELVEGDSLTSRIEGEGMPLRQLLEIAIPMTEAIAAAHDRQIVHRDLKPDNVMISSERRVKVLDFGLAKLRADGAALSTDNTVSIDQTQVGTVLGTLAYMSPEQAQGQPAGPASDVFSLGQIFFEMATGSRPFQGNNAISLLSAVLKDPTPSLINRAGLPPQFDEIIHRCLEKDPEERYPTAGELRDDLTSLRDELVAAAVLSSSSISGVSSVGTVTRGGATGTGDNHGRRAAVAALAVIAAVAALVAGIGFFSADPDDRGQHEREMLQATAAPSVAIMPLVSSNTDAASLEFADGIHDDLILQASKIRALKVISRTSVIAFRGSEKSLSQIAHELGVTTVMEGSVRRSGDRVRINVKVVDGSSEQTLWGDTYERELNPRNIFAIQSEIVEQIARALEATLSPAELRAIQEAPTDNIDAYTWYQRGQALARESPTNESLAAKIVAFQKAIVLDPKFAEGWAALAIAHVQYYWRGEDHTAARLELALAAIEEAERLHPGLPQAAAARGYFHYWGYRDYPAALAAFAEAELGLPSDALLIATRSFIQRRLGQWEESLATLDRALELDPLSGYLLENKKNTMLTLRRWDEARAILAHMELVGVDVEMVAQQRTSLQRSRCGTIPESNELLDFITSARFALPDHERAVEIVDSSSQDVFAGQMSWRTRSFVKGELLALAGQESAASPYLLAGHAAVVDQLLVNPDDARLHSALGLVLAYLGDAAGAVQSAKRATELVSYAVDAMDAGEYQLSLAQVQAITGDASGAIVSLEVFLSNPGLGGVESVERDPRFATLRGNPAFERLMARYRDAAANCPAGI